MKIELLGALNYEKLSEYVNNEIKEIIDKTELVEDYIETLKNSKMYTPETIMNIDDVIEFIKVNVKEEDTTLVDNLKELKTSIYENDEKAREQYQKVLNDLKILKEDYKEKANRIIEETKQQENERKTNIVATAGRLSRYPGTVFEVLESVEQKDVSKNSKFASTVIGMGHESISDHDYCVFAIENVSPIVEQIIIAERFSSFTIKSRREADFRNAGFYVPDFRNKDGKIISNNNQAKKFYVDYMKSLFDNYSYFVENGIPKEDARFILPYSYYSNILMGIDAHTLKNMIIKFTKTKYANIEEVRKFGERLYEIASEKVPYIIPGIDAYEEKKEDSVDEYLNKYIIPYEYEILDKVKLLNHPENIDDTILISAIMRRYQYDLELAKEIYDDLVTKYPYFKDELMKKIAFEGDMQELTQVSFQYQIPISLAILTHLTRHRTHQMLIPDFAPVIDLLKYKTPPKIRANEKLNEKYDDIYTLNRMMYDKFKYDFKVRDEDLVYFTLSGNMVNILTNIDGKALKHILGLRECNKAQWETRWVANGMHKELDELDSTSSFTKILGPSCETQGICNEGKECCGKVLALNKKD